jgi:hypothetical protein
MIDVHEVYQLAIDICRSLDSHFSGDGELGPTGLSSLSALLICSNCAHKVFYRRSYEARWVERVLVDVANRSGIELARI